MNTIKLGGARAWLIWSIAVLFVLWLFNAQTGYAILNEHVAKTIGLGIEQISLIAAVYTWVFAGAQLFSGALLDRAGSRKVLIPAITLVGIGIFLFAFAKNFEMLLISQVVLAVGASAGFVGAGYVGGVWFGIAKFGIMFGFVQTAAATSSAFGQTAFNFALQKWSWREVMVGLGVFGVVLLIMAVLFVRNPEPVKKVQGKSFIISIFSSIAEVLKKAQIWIIAFQGAIVFGMILALGVVWGPKIMIAHGLGESAANISTACIWLGLAVGSFFINRISEALVSRKKPIIVCSLLQLSALSAALFLPMTPTLAMIFYFLFGLGNSGHMLNFTAAADNVPPQLIGTSSSIVNGSMFIAGGILMSAPGKILKDKAGTLDDYQHAMLICVGALVAAFIAAFLIKESHPKRVSKN